MTPDPSKGNAADRVWTRLTPEEIEAMCPADPDLIHSPEGETREVRKLRAEIRARREELARKYPGYLIS